MVIPKDSIKFKDGTKYPLEIKMDFDIPNIKGRLKHISYEPFSNIINFRANQPFKCNNLSKIEIMDSKGKKMGIRIKKVWKFLNIISFEFKGEVDESETYTMTVPEGLIDFKFSGKNQKPLITEFKLEKIQIKP